MQEFLAQQDIESSAVQSATKEPIEGRAALEVLERAGDNRVVERYGYLEGADIHPVKQHHGSLWNDNDVKMRIRLELLRE